MNGCETKCRNAYIEAVDDSLKSGFMAYQAYEDEHAIKALAILASQINERIPAIESDIKKQCEFAPDTKNIQAELAEMQKLMLEKAPKEKVHNKIYAMDLKYTLANYASYCSCSKR